MNYFYDLLVNLNDSNTYYFYEWNNNDPLLHLKKVPIYRINTSSLKKIIKNNIVVNQDFLDSIHNETEVYSSDNKHIKYMAIFTDANNSILLEFNDCGQSIFRSSLLIEEELDLLEISSSLKKEKVNFKVINNVLNKTILRQEEEFLKFLNIEINNLKNSNNNLKMRYLYNEIFNKDEKDFNKQYTDLINLLKNGYNKNTLKLYNIIKLSYNRLSA